MRLIKGFWLKIGIFSAFLGGAAILEAALKEELNTYLHSVFSHEAMSEWHEKSFLDREVGQQLLDLVEKVQDCCVRMPDSFHKIVGVPEALSKLLQKFNYIKELLDGCQKKKIRHAEVLFEKLLFELEGFQLEHDITMEDVQTADKESRATILKRPAGVDLLVGLQRIKENARDALHEFLQYKKLTEEQQQKVKSFGLQSGRNSARKRAQKGKRSPAKNMSFLQANEQLKVIMSQTYDQLNEVECALQEKDVCCLGLSVVLDIPKNKETFELVERLKRIFKISNTPSEDSIRLSQEFDIITRHEVVECKRVSSDTSKYVVNLIRQKFFTDFIDCYSFSTSYDTVLSKDAVIALLKDKDVRCQIAYKDDECCTNTKRFALMCTRKAHEARLNHYALNFDNGMVISQVIDLSVTDALHRIIAFKKKMLDSPRGKSCILKFIVPEGREEFCKAIVDMSGIFAKDYVEGEQLRPRRASEPLPVGHARGEQYGELGLRDIPQTPVGILRAPVWATKIVKERSRGKEFLVRCDEERLKERLLREGAHKEVSRLAEIDRMPSPPILSTAPPQHLKKVHTKRN